MNIKKHALLLTFLFCTVFPSADAYMIDNPLNLSSELALTNDFNFQINSFWSNNAQSHYFIGVDNKQIHTISIIGDNDKAIVISQGRNESVLKYKEVAYDFYTQGYDVFLIDHRGQGFSERYGGDQSRGDVIDFQDYISDFNQYVSSLALEKNYSHRYLLSHSMGGTISALYLEQYKHPFQATLFFSPMLSINLGILPSFVAKMIAYSSAEICGWFSNKACYVPMGEDYKHSPFVDNPLTHSETRYYSGRIGFEAFPETQLGSPTMRWLATSISATEQAIKKADNITIPTLIFQAGSDTVVTSAGQEALFNNLPNCHFNKLNTVKGAKHEILIERDEYRLNALNQTFNFLNQITQGEQTCTQ